MHSLRHSLHDQLHARPSLYYKESAHVFHVAIMGTDHERLALLNRLAVDPIDHELSQGITRLDGNRLKWDRHAEFLTLTCIAACSPGSLAWAPLPEALVIKLSGYSHLVINSVQIAVGDEDSCNDAPCAYGFKAPCGSSMGGGDATV